jgi:hypothetical protein
MDGACQGTSSMLSQCVVVQSHRYKPLVCLYAFRQTTYECGYFVHTSVIWVLASSTHPDRQVAEDCAFLAASLWQRFCDGSFSGALCDMNEVAWSCPPQFISNFVSIETSWWSVAVFLTTVTNLFVLPPYWDCHIRVRSTGAPIACLQTLIQLCGERTCFD